MFGSLVIVLPSTHEGGELVLHHGDQEWMFDSAQATRDARGPSVGYAAFFSDVEHEVRMVTSGHRVTLTYNLYFAETGRSYVVSKLSGNVPSVAPAVADAFKSTLTTLLADSSFLPSGGYLGFGMRHEYPINTATKYGDSRDFYDMRPDRPEGDSLARLGEMLKGSDAAVSESCRSLGLTVTLNVVHTHESLSVLFDGVPNFEGMNTEYGFIEKWLRDEHHPRVIATSTERWMTACQVWLDAVSREFQEAREGKIKAGADDNDTYRVGEFSQRNEAETEQRAVEGLIFDFDEDEIDMDDVQDPEDDPRLDIVVHWVTPSTPLNAFKSNIIAYGNESNTECLYGRVCLIVEVGSPGEREGKAKPVV